MIKIVYVVECFDTRNEGAGAGGKAIGGSIFYASGGVFVNIKNARRAMRTAKKSGLAVSLRGLQILDSWGK